MLLVQFISGLVHGKFHGGISIACWCYEAKLCPKLSNLSTLSSIQHCTMMLILSVILCYISQNFVTGCYQQLLFASWLYYIGHAHTILSWTANAIVHAGG